MITDLLKYAPYLSVLKSVSEQKMEDFVTTSSFTSLFRQMGHELRDGEAEALVKFFSTGDPSSTVKDYFGSGAFVARLREVSGVGAPEPEPSVVSTCRFCANKEYVLKSALQSFYRCISCDQLTLPMEG